MFAARPITERVITHKLISYSRHLAAPHIVQRSTSSAVVVVYVDVRGLHDIVQHCGRSISILNFIVTSLIVGLFVGSCLPHSSTQLLIPRSYEPGGILKSCPSFAKLSLFFLEKPTKGWLFRKM
mmetsp:Transcript_39349/g.63032  ORF Transcript_39349/g.63032 Transcript_39349/m.63032 type:complete len:124 (+) Transcript_39349:26-397(+)